MDSSNSFITSTEEITPQRITAQLRDSAALRSGSVIEVRLEQDLKPPMSNMACILGLSYSGNAQGTLPERVFFKNGRMPGEVGFARKIAPLLKHRSIVECYSAQFENELGQSNLILEDISETHKFMDPNAGLTADELEAVSRALAEFHRLGWEHPELSNEKQIGANLNDLPNNLALPRARQMLDPFFEALGAQLTDDHRRRYSRIFESLPHPAWLARRTELKNITVVHGDVHTGNIALPRITEAGFVRLLDWSLWHIDLPTYDLTYLLALRTPTGLRREIEQRLLESYHTALALPQYSLEQLMDDYRLSIVFQTIWPVFFHGFTPQEIWTSLYENIMQAFDDWNCDILLK